MHPMFMYETWGIASVTGVRLSGKPAYGGAVLVVRVDLTTQPARKGESPPRIVSIGGRVVSLAPLAPVLGLWECVNYAQDAPILLEAYLTNAQVRAVDAARDGDGDIRLTVALEALVNGEGGLKPASLSYPLAVTRSDWNRVLKEMQFEARATFEVPVEGGRVGPPLDKAAAHMRTALDRVQDRHWHDALKACREVLDELQQYQTVQMPPWGDWADRSKREAWSVDERLVAAQAVVRNMTHAGAHAEIGNADEGEVRLAVTMTAALLRYYAAR